LNVQNIEENMQNTRFLNRLVGLGVAASILLVVALAVFAGSALETASSSIDSVVQLTQHPDLLLRQPNPPANSAHPQPTNQVRVSAAYNSLPLYFEANRGQTDPQVKFVSRGSGYTLFLTRGAEAVLVLRKPTPKRDPLQPPALVSAGVAPQFEPASPPAVVRMKLVGRNARPRVEGLDELLGKANYFIGSDRKKWRTNVPMYSTVRYREVYPGVDLVYYGNQRQLEHDYIVAPGADPGSIRLNLAGVEKLSLDSQGYLSLGVRGGELRLEKPRIYQEVDGVRREVSGCYVLKGTHQVSFQVAAYDAGRSLIIDPVLFYSTYLGGSGKEQGGGGGAPIAVDSSGNAYVTGATTSSNFPTTSGAFQTTFADGSPDGDAFVTKLNPTGSGLVYSTYLGGSGSDDGHGIVVDSAGNAYVTGSTSSANFPTTPGAFQTTFGGSFDVFVTKLNPTGAGLVYSTYVGGSGDDEGSGIAVDATGSAYITGYTASPFPTTPGAFQTTFGGGSSDAFVTKLNPTGSGLVYSTYLGGSGNDVGKGIAVDATGSAYVTGYAASPFPTTPGAFQTIFGGGSADVFVTRIDPTGSTLIYSTYLGGSGDDVGLDLTADASGDAYVTGDTTSTNFPTTPGVFQTTFGGTHDAFVTKLSSTGSGLVYSTYLGGSGNDRGFCIAVDSAGNAYVTGDTTSTDFPTVNATQSTIAGGSDAYVTTLNPTASGLVYSTYLGGSSNDSGVGIALDSLPNPNAYVLGFTSSTNFPTTAGAYQTTFAGGAQDAFVAKIANITLPPGPTVGKVTGGGTVDVSGGIANFGFIVQRQAADNSIHGDLQYQNHASGAKVHSVMFSTFTISGNAATFSGTCTNNDAPCTFTVTVQDNDQPPGSDSFVISINGGPPEGGTLRDGDIEIH
jgi:hypothetical protein